MFDFLKTLTHSRASQIMSYDDLFSVDTDGVVKQNFAKHDKCVAFSVAIFRVHRITVDDRVRVLFFLNGIPAEI